MTTETKKTTERDEMLARVREQLDECGTDREKLEELLLFRHQREKTLDRRFTDINSSLADTQRKLSQVAREAFMALPLEDRIDLGVRAIEEDYRNDVSGVVDDLKEQIKSGDITSRDDLLERVHESVDGRSSIIYTAQNFRVLLATRNHDAWFEQGLGDLSENNAFAQLAFAAMEQDVMEALKDDGVDPNAEPDEWDVEQPCDDCHSTHKPSDDCRCAREGCENEQDDTGSGYCSAACMDAAEGPGEPTP